MKRSFLILFSLFLVLTMILVMFTPVLARASVPPSGSAVTKQAPTFQVTKPPAKVKPKAAQSIQSTPESDFTFDAATGTILQYIGSDTIVDIPSTIGGVNVLHIGEEAFVTTAVTSVTIPDGVLSLGLGAFGYCASLTDVSIPNSVTSFDKYVFYGCSALEHITLPDQLESIGDACFLNCVSLKSITIPNSVTSLGIAAFYWCFSLEEVTLSNQLTRIEEFTFELCEPLKSITIPDSVTYVGYHAFWACAAAESLTLSQNLTTIEEEAFYYLPLLTSIEVPNSVTYIGDGAFKYAEQVTSLTLSDHLTYIGSTAFSQCISLESVTIPETVTTIGNNAFAYDGVLEAAYFNGNAPTNWGNGVFLNTASNFTIYYLSESTDFTSPTYQGYPAVCLYRVDVASTTGGSVSVSSSRAAAGTTVTLTITPDFGMSVQSVYYQDTGGQHAITGNQFIMPASDVTVGAVFGWNALFLFIAFTVFLGIIGFIIWLLF